MPTKKTETKVAETKAATATETKETKKAPILRIGLAIISPLNDDQ